jgi:Integrase zinc binding domain
MEHDLIDCFLHLLMSENIPFIHAYANIAQAQPGDTQLQILHAQKPNQYTQKILAPNLSLWCYQKTQDQPWRIYLPQDMLESAVMWYHHALSHVGRVRLTDTMSMTFYNPQLHKIVEAVVAPCAHCQRYKNVQRGHGATAPRESRSYAVEPCCCRHNRTMGLVDTAQTGKILCAIWSQISLR